MKVSVFRHKLYLPDSGGVATRRRSVVVRTIGGYFG